MPVLTMSSAPNTYAPATGYLPFKTITDSYSIANFKYVYDLYQIDEVNGITSSLGRYIIPPDTTGVGNFSPHEILQSQLTYDINPGITDFATAQNSITKYAVGYGYQWNPGVEFLETFSASGFFAFVCSSNPTFSTGDIIVVNKDDKTINAYYDGTCSVTGVFGSIVATDKQFNIQVGNTASPYYVNAFETGRITSQTHVKGLTSGFYAFNGTRQYQQQGFDFSQYLIGSLSGYTQFLTNHPANEGFSSYDSNAKSIYITNYETISFLIDQVLYPASYFIIVVLYNKNGGVITTHTYNYTLSSAYHRIDFPTGPANLLSMGVSFTNVDHYEVRMEYSSFPVPQPLCSMFYNLVSNCSPHTNVRILWLNRLGGIDYFNFNWMSKNTISTTKTLYKKELPYNYNIGDREDTVLAQKASEAWLVSSDFITEPESNWLKELFTSPEVYVLDETTGLKYPIIISDTSYTVKTRLNDRLIAVSFNYVLAYSINIQNS
jgi:hypothetical protein